jgi:PAS domain S-box-containing protein
MPTDDARTRVLVLDDDPGALLLERRALERAGYDVLAAATHEEAVRQASSGDFGVMVLDYRLSGAASGLDVFRQLRESGHLAPAILVTSFADESKIIEALRTGIRDVVPKSGDYLEYLPQAVGRLAGQIEAERRLARSDMLQNLVDRLRAETHTLETINGVGRQLAIEHDAPALVQRVTDACTQVVGAQFGAFLEARDDGRAFVLAAASGAERDRVEAFARLHDVPFGRTDDHYTVLSDDIGADRRFEVAGTDFAVDGAPQTRSYLAVPVASRSGELLGALLFGHAEIRRFHDREARLAEGIAAQAAIAIDNARLIEALRTSEDRLRLSTEAARLGTWDYNPITGTLAWSDRCRELFGLPESMAIDFAAYMQAVHPLDREATYEAIRRALDPASSGQRFEVEHRTAGLWDGRVRWIRGLGRVFFSEGRAARFIGTAQDITAERAAIEERERLLESERAARSESERAGHLKDEFLATLSHELRTPLNAVLGWAQLVRTRASTPQQVAEGLDRIERNARAQAQIIDDLLDMSRIVLGKMRLDVQPVDLPAIVESSIDGMRPAAEAKGILVQPALDPACGPISGDPGRLQQVLWNLLSNAIKFTPRGGYVRVRLQRAESHVEIAVEDSGQGIKAEFQPFLFDRFRQGDASTTRQHRGMGLGLSIVRNIVEMHGGTVQARSDGEQRGATFIVRLPLGVELQPGPAGSEPGVAWPAVPEAPPATSSQDLAHVRVLLVDDEADARELIGRILHEYEAEVIAVASAAEALEAIQATRPDVVVSDIGLPGADGYALIRAIRQRPASEGGGVPALALTAFARAEDRDRALAAGYQAHLAKPASAAELVSAVVALTQGSRLKAQGA